MEIVELYEAGKGCVKCLVEAVPHLDDLGVTECLGLLQENRGFPEVGDGDFWNGIVGDGLEMVCGVCPGVGFEGFVAGEDVCKFSHCLAGNRTIMWHWAIWDAVS